MQKVRVDDARAFSQEVVALYERILKGEVTPRFADKWGWTDSGNLNFIADGWKVRLFMDGGGLDYTDYVEAPDGRFAEFDDFWPQDEMSFGPEQLVADPSAWDDFCSEPKNFKKF